MDNHRPIDVELPINQGNPEPASTTAIPSQSGKSDNCERETSVSCDVANRARLPTESASTSKQQLSSKSPDTKPLSRDHTTSWKAYQSVFRGWWIEIISFLVLCLSLFAIFITLYLHEGQPLQQWHLGITINTLVAIYAVVFKAAIALITAQGLSKLKWVWFCEKPRPLIDISRIDEASRGPWGSLMLLAKMRNSYIVALVGALITICSFAIDPFAQLIIHFEECLEPDPRVIATLPRRNTYGEVGLHEGAGIDSLSASLQFNINAGVINPIDVEFQCPSGNCIFPSPYYSVAWCSSCTDVSKDLILNCSTSENEYAGFDEPISNCNASLPSGLTAYFIDSSYINYLAVGSPDSEGDTYQVIMNSLYNSTKSDTWQANGVGAAECSFWACINSYQATIKTGKLTENVLSTTGFSGNQGGELYQSIRVDCLSQSEYHVLRLAGYLNDSQANAPWIGLDSSLVNLVGSQGDELIFSGPDGRNFSLSARCIYRFVFNSEMSIYNFLLAFLNGTVTGDQVEYYHDLRGPSQIQALYNYGLETTFADIESKFAGIAESVTSHIRQHTRNDTFGTPEGYQLDA